MKNKLKEIIRQYRREKILWSPVWRHNAFDLQKVSEGQKTSCLFCGTDLGTTPNSSYSFEELAEVHKHFIGYTCTNCGAHTWHHYAVPEDVNYKEITIDNYSNFLKNCLFTEAVISTEDYMQIVPNYYFKEELISFREKLRNTRINIAQNNELLKQLDQYALATGHNYGMIRVYKGNPLYKQIKDNITVSQDEMSWEEEVLTSAQMSYVKKPINYDIYIHGRYTHGHHVLQRWRHGYGYWDHREYFVIQQEVLDDIVKDK